MPKKIVTTTMSQPMNTKPEPALALSEGNADWHEVREAVEALEALAAPPDPWNRRPATGWTAETLPRFNMGQRYYVGLTNRGNMKLSDIVYTIDSYWDMVAWRYIDPPGPVDEEKEVQI